MRLVSFGMICGSQPRIARQMVDVLEEVKELLRSLVEESAA